MTKSQLGAGVRQFASAEVPPLATQIAGHNPGTGWCGFYTGTGVNRTFAG